MSVGNEAFLTFIRENERLIYNIAYKYTRNVHDAKDICQEAVLKAYKSLGSCADETSLKAWVCRITVNTALDALRRKKRTHEDEVLDITDVGLELHSGPTPEEELLVSEKKAQVYNAVNQLPEDFRALIILRDLQGLSYEELCEATDLKMGTVKSKLSRARLALKKLLSDKKFS